VECAAYNVSIPPEVTVMKKLLLPLLFLCASALAAQDSASPQALPVPKVDFRWDFLLRYDETEGIPARIGTTPIERGFERGRLQLRPGVLFTPIPWATIEARGVIHANTKDDEFFPLADGTSKRIIAPNDHFTFTGRQDNFEPNSITIDRLNVQLRPTAGAMVSFGKFENPFDTTEAFWDRDLQPEGVAASFDFGPQDELHYRATGGAFLGTQLYGDDSRIFAGQASLMSGATWPLNFSLSLGYYDFDELDVLAQRNWRQNATIVVGGVRQFVSDFNVADALFRIGTDRLPVPIELHYDYIYNMGAELPPNAPATLDEEGLARGTEAGLRVGPFPGPGNIRFQYVYQDLDRDAVMAGFNTDDWYLHSWYRGSLYRISGTVWKEFTLGATYIDLRHHDAVAPGNPELGDLTRIFVDLTRRY
jgi:hypothetical protein